MRRSSLLFLAVCGIAANVHAAGERTPRVHALVHARVVTRPGTVLENATVILRDGLVTAVGTRVEPPADAQVVDCTGRTLYAGLVEPYLDRTKPASKSQGSEERSAEKPAAQATSHANPRVHPETDVVSTLALSAEELDELHAVGFAVAHVVPGSGVFRGQSAVVALRDGAVRQQVVRARHAQIVAFERDSGGQRRAPVYPNSVMGSIALVRQTLLDAGWARDCDAHYSGTRGGVERPESNAALLALAPTVDSKDRQPLWMRADDVLGVLRAAAIEREFGLDAVVVGGGDEYRQLAALREAKVRLVLPVAFPEAPRVEDPDEALDVDLETLRHWEAAPENPRRVQAAGLPFAFTSNGLRKRSAYLTRVRTAVERGLSPEAALAAVTTVPARWLGLEDRIGTIEPGKQAHLTITDGDLFADKTRVLEVWVDGDRYVVRPKGDALEKVRGEWSLSTRSGDARSWALSLEGSEWTLRGDLDERPLDEARWEQGTLIARRGSDAFRLTPGSGKLTGTWKSRPDAPAVAVEAKRAAGASKTGGDTAAKGEANDAGGSGADKDKKVAGAKVAGSADTLFAWPPRPAPAPRAVLVRNATIWTSGPRGTLEKADLLCAGGKIQAVGSNLKPPAGAFVIDAQGKHVTPGLIDCHSHSNIVGGVNEATNSCTAEVRIADVINSESIAIYRELAGGLTASNQLHGSANAIGGQNAVMKLRWGASPRELLFEGAPPGIKFALGENPKQSNWDDRNDRYPQTRMGVEQSIRERFIAARDYMRAWDESKRGKSKLPPRRDLQLEAISEILRGERLVHCHSYRADEILMMMRLAEQFGFRVATFQHVLEGYKVADELAAHGAGASSFSDWWAYKFEVYDAVPHNGAILYERGVVTSFNSDSSELARHLNLEAAKAVKYGGVPEAEALRFVTLNPAKQLRIDKRVGSLEPGKDADFAIWSESPLTSTTHCEQTWIEGRRYFDFDTDRNARGALEAERNRLVEAARGARESKSDSDDAGASWHPSYWNEEDASCHDEEVEP